VAVLTPEQTASNLALHVKTKAKVQSVVSSAWIDGRIGLRCRVIGRVASGAATPAFPGVAYGGG